MARGPANFKQGDVTRVLRAAKEAGIDVQSFEIDRNGKIVVVCKPRSVPDSIRSDWDEVLHGDG
jgi:hypothetical protein